MRHAPKWISAKKMGKMLIFTIDSAWVFPIFAKKYNENPNYWRLWHGGFAYD